MMIRQSMFVSRRRFYFLVLLLAVFQLLIGLSSGASQSIIGHHHQQQQRHHQGEKKPASSSSFFTSLLRRVPGVCHGDDGCCGTSTVARGGSDEEKGVPHHGSHSSSSKVVTTKPRKACGLYVWNAPSALLYKWCHHLLKDHIYEGRGGIMFVRYESNSILQLLYPCNRYSPNQCLICGGSFPDHLELWWSTKHLYSPYDQNLDKIYKQGVVLDETDHQENTMQSSNALPKRSRRRNRNVNLPQQPSTLPKIYKRPPKYAFHHAYVKDVSDWIQNEKSTKRQMEIIKAKLEEEEQLSNNDKRKGKWRSSFSSRNRSASKLASSSSAPSSLSTSTKGMRLTRFPRYGVAYILPPSSDDRQSSSPSQNEDDPSRKTKKKYGFISNLIRSICLTILDDFIMLQESENRKLEYGK